jgi:SAM-dependent methyltransferase
VKWIALAARITEEEARRRLYEEHQRLGANVGRAMQERNIEPHCWSEEMRRFYEETDAFLFESVAWSRTRAKRGMLDWILDWIAVNAPPPRRVLAFGDGPGFDSLRLAKAGYNAVHHDPSGPGLRFARLLFEHAGRELCSVTDLAELEVYDAILCLDVLEHVPDPPAMVQTLSGRLRDGGHLFVHAPFFATIAECPTHLRSNLRYCGDLESLYVAAGLFPVAGRTLWNPIVLRKQCAGRISRRLAIGRAAVAIARTWHAPHTLAARYAALAGRRELSRMIC